MHNAFHCAKCNETCHRSLCNYFLQTLKNKRRPENKFGVAALFPRFTTKRIPFARNFVQMGSHMFSSAHRFAIIFCRLQKIKEDQRTSLESLRCFLDLLQKGSRLHETSCKWDPTCSPLHIALQLFFADSKK